MNTDANRRNTEGNGSNNDGDDRLEEEFVILVVFFNEGEIFFFKRVGFRKEIGRGNDSKVFYRKMMNEHGTLIV
jgi:hypothetical protein